MINRRYVTKGFTIVELLIVIVVIGILAAITIVSFSGATSKANDVAVQSDLRNLADLVSTSTATSSSGIYPTDGTGLATLGLRVTKNSYGGNLVDQSKQYNLLYCSTTATSPTANFAFVASSKSGNVYAITSNSGVTVYSKANWTASGAGWGTICPSLLNVEAGNSSTGVWLYENSIWKDYISG